MVLFAGVVAFRLGFGFCLLGVYVWLDFGVLVGVVVVANLLAACCLLLIVAIWFGYTLIVLFCVRFVYSCWFVMGFRVWC